ncbi:MAG: hypothetical protein MRY83_10090 [Flavobacteriales bacterium]|nr:hypothetical protein [Flavobacteriales bacterium]
MKFLFTSIAVLLCAHLLAQHNIGTNATNANATMQIQSADSSQGLVIPFVTTANRPAAGASTEGMIIYNVADSVLQMSDGLRWINVTPYILSDRDGDTKIQVEESYDEDRIRFDTDGSERMVILQNGNVGIGTTSAANALTVAESNQDPIFTAGGLAANTTFSVYNNNTLAQYSSIGFQTRPNGNNAATAMIGLEHTTANGGDMFFRLRNGINTSSSEILRLTYDGNVGVGTNNPSTKFHIHNDVTGADSAFVITQQGLVGIGTTGPVAPLNVVTNSFLVDAAIDDKGSANTSFFLRNTSTGYNANNDGLAIGMSGLGASFINKENGQLAIGTNNEVNILVHTDGNVGIGSGVTAARFHVTNDVTGADSAFVVTDGGNVGVGLSTPGQRLDVNGVIRTNSWFFAPNQSGVYANGELFLHYDRTTHSTTNGFIQLGANFPTTLSGIAGSQIEVGIGKTTFAPTSGNAEYGSLLINPTINQTGGANGDIIGINYNPTLTAVGGSHYAAIFQSGNVGIGTNAPSDELHIEGSIRMVDGNQANGRILVSDANGTATWTNASSLADSIATLVDTDGDTKIQVEESSDEDKIRFDTDGNERMIIDENGNIGIGTTTPSSKLWLQTTSGNTNGFIMDGMGGHTIRLYGNTSNSNVHLTRQGQDDEGITFNNDGLVGIGTSDPNAALHIRNEGTEDIFNAYDDGSEVMTILDGGTVGIGTSNPTAILDIGKAVDGDVLLLELRNDLGSADDTASMKLGSGDAIGSGTYLRHMRQGTLGGDFGIFTSPTVGSATVERMRVTKDGNVGIGTTGPEQLFEVQSTEGNDASIALDADDGDDNEDTWFFTSKASSNSLVFTNHSTDQMILTSDGSLGIGGQSPSKRFQILQSPSLTAYFRVDVNTTSGYTTDLTMDDAGLTFSNNSSRDFIFSPNSSEAMRIKWHGLVGIGTNNPLGKLHVHNDVSGVDSVFIVTQAGNLGIGTTSPDEELHIEGSIRMVDGNQANGRVLVSDANGTATWTNASSLADSIAILVDTDGDTKVQVEESSDEDKIRFDTDGNERMIIDENGNVGIGTSTTSDKLHVYGTLRLDGATSAYGTINYNSGTNSLDQRLFAGGTNYNFYIDDNDGFKFDVGGSERVRIQPGGNVGIGTNNPNAYLNVLNSRSGNGEPAINIDRVNAASYEAGLWYSTNGSYKWFMGLENDGTDALRLWNHTNSEWILHILENGNIGIGSATPSAKLNLVATTATNATRNTIINNSGGDDILELHDDGLMVVKDGYAKNTNTAFLEGMAYQKSFLDNNGVILLKLPKRSGQPFGGYGQFDISYYKYNGGADDDRVAWKATFSGLWTPAGVATFNSTFYTDMYFSDSLHYYTDGTDFYLVIGDETDSQSNDVVLFSVDRVLARSNGTENLTFDNEFEMTFETDLSAYTRLEDLTSAITRVENDHDWYEVGTSAQPNAITDNIYTQGNVGIGSANPTEKLDVNGDVAISSGYLKAGSNAGNFDNIIRSNSAQGNLIAANIANDLAAKFQAGTGAATSYLNIMGDGQVRQYTHSISGSTTVSDYSGNFTRSSGADDHTQIEIGTTINQTATATGTLRGIYINPALASISGSYRGIEISADHANAYGIYQSGSNALNYFSGQIGFGTTNPSARITVANSSNDTLAAFRVHSTQTAPIFVFEQNDGDELFRLDSDDSTNVFLGSEAGDNNAPSGSDGMHNTFIGHRAGASNSTGDGNTFIGHRAGQGTTTGQWNTIVGSNINGPGSGVRNSILGYNIAIGSNASQNVILGYTATTSGNIGGSNVIIGSECTQGNTNSLSGCVIIGRDAGKSISSANSLAINNSDEGETGSLIYGRFDQGFVRINNNLGMGTSSFGSGTNVIAIENGTEPSSSITDGILLYAKDFDDGDASSTSELFVRDEDGNATDLSPHNFSLIPGGKSEEMAWAFYSERNDKIINVDMTKVIRAVENLTGEKYVYIKDQNDDAKTPMNKENRESLIEIVEKQQRLIEILEERIQKLENENTPK